MMPLRDTWNGNDAPTAEMADWLNTVATWINSLRITGGHLRPSDYYGNAPRIIIDALMGGGQGRFFEGFSKAGAQTVGSTTGANPTKVIWDETRDDVSLDGSTSDATPPAFSINSPTNDVITMEIKDQWWFALCTLNLSAALVNQDVEVTANMYFDATGGATKWHAFNEKHVAQMFSNTISVTTVKQDKEELTLFQPFFGSSTGGRDEFFVGLIKDLAPIVVTIESAHLMIMAMAPI